MLKVQGFHGYNVKFSPVDRNLVALVGGVNFGLSGKGALFLIKFDEAVNSAQTEAHLTGPDVFTDLAFHPTQGTLIASCGNGHVFIADAGLSPIKSLKCHDREITSLHWPQPELLLSSSWDGLVKCWDAGTFTVRHQHESDTMVFDAKSSIDGLVASAGEGQLSLIDWRQKTLIGTLKHGSDVLCLDWMPGDSCQFLSGAADGVLRLWDVRQCSLPIRRFLGHDYAVRKVIWSHFNKDTFLSCSYDKTVRQWQVSHRGAGHHKKLEHHTEFVYGLDTSPFYHRLAVDCSWDSTVKFFNVAT